MKLKLLDRLRFNPGVVGIVVGITALGLGGLQAVHHARAHTPVEPSPIDSVSTAGVAAVTREDLFREVTISAEFRPYAEVDLHAKVSGFVRHMNVDFGDEVKAGQLLATLEVPELQDELNNAQATEQKAQADYTNAHLICNRLLAVNQNHSNLVAQQDLDTAAAADQTTAASLAAAKANVEKFQSLFSYTKISSPFDGIITRRYADPGALIQAGTSSDTQAKPLVRVSDNYRLRLDFPVTVDYVKNIYVGDSVRVRVDSLNGKTLTGTISRCTHDVDDRTRTMLTEVEVPNADLELVPGMYATVILKIDKRPQALAVPTEAVLSGSNPTVYLVNSNRQIEERAVKLGLETADKYEVLAGLHEGDLVLIGNRSQFRPGETVDPKPIQLSLRDEK